MMKYKYFIPVILILAFAQISWGQSGLSILNTQGFLRDPVTGGALSDDTYQLTFKLYDQQTGGTSLWTEVHDSVAVTNGMFSVDLGTITSFSSVVFDTQYWLGISVNSDPELSPRMKLTTAPYAITMIGTDNQFPASGDVTVGGGNLKITGSGKGIQFPDSTRLESANISISYLSGEGGNPNNAVIVNDVGRVGIGIDPTYRLHVNGNMQVDGNLTNGSDYDLYAYDELDVDGTFEIDSGHPVRLEKYNFPANISAITHVTGYLYDDWVAMIAGFDAGYGDIKETGDGELLEVRMEPYTAPSLEIYWAVCCKIRTSGGNGDIDQADWQIDVMFIKRNMAQAPINY